MIQTLSWINIYLQKSKARTYIPIGDTDSSATYENPICQS